MSERGVQALIAELRDFRTRSTAAKSLAGLGQQALQPLLAALEEESQEGAKWAMINCLGQIGARQAVPALVRYLEESDYEQVAQDALTRIAGRDLGAAPADWLRWLEQEAPAPSEPAPAPAPVQQPPAVQEPASELPDRQLLEQALEKTGATWREEAANRYLVDVPLPGGRRQQVTVVFGSKDQEGSDIVLAYSLCGKARPERYEAGLRYNLRMPYGALALRDIGGKPYFVMLNTILRKALTAIELRKTVVAIGERSDRARREL
jgi:hypothetical protein